MSVEALVIGAGLGGLAAAIVLAARGLSVEIVEAGPRAGGKAGVAVVDGVEFDTGPSVLTLPEVLDAVLRSAGTCLADELRLRTPEPAFRYVFPDGVVLDLHHAPEASVESARAALGGEAAQDLQGFLEYAARIWDLSAPAFVFGPAPGLHLLRTLGPGALLQFRHVDPFRTMWAAIEARVRSPHLRTILARYATYNGSDPRAAPATLNCISHVELGLGGYGVEGGVYELVRALERVARRVGVRLRFGEAVERIEVRGGQATGVALRGGERLPAQALICNADVAHLFADLLPEGPAPSPADRPSMSGWTAVARARRRAGAQARVAHTVIFPEDYAQEFEDIFDHDRPPRSPTVYLCAQEACHGRAGWPEHEPVFLMANAPPEPASGPSPGARWSELEARALATTRAAGLLHADDALVWSRSPTGLAQAFPGSRGSLYGAASNSMFAAFRRPPNRAPAPRGLYLASGSAHPGGGMPLCIQSGRAAANALLSDLGLGDGGWT